MTSPLGMALVGDRRSEKGHNTIPGELIDRTFVSMDLIHQYLEAPVHDLMDFLGIEFFRNGRTIGDIGKEYGYLLSFTFDSAPI